MRVDLSSIQHRIDTGCLPPPIEGIERPSFSGVELNAPIATHEIRLAVWAEVIQADVDPAVVTDSALRDAIKATGLPCRVRDKGTNMEMLLIPPDEFVMGKSRGDHLAYRNELPAQKVK